MPEPRTRTASPPTVRLTAGVCTVHLIRGSFRYASRKYWNQLSKDLKPIYTAVDTDAALAALDDLDDTWGSRYPAIIRLWRNAWAEFIPFLDYATSRSGGSSAPRMPSRI